MSINEINAALLKVSSDIGTGYRYVQTLVFWSSGTFTKASYPWLRAVRAKIIGGGGGGGNTNTLNTGAGGGSGGPYVEAFITDIAKMAASETVTVGAGGTGADYASTGGGSSGGTSSFGSYAVASGGFGGGGGSTALGGFPGVIGAEDITPYFLYTISGEGGMAANSGTLNGAGGRSVFGPGGQSVNSSMGFTAFSRAQGYAPGGGGAGSWYTSNTFGASTGGFSGGSGVVILELYA